MPKISSQKMAVVLTALISSFSSHALEFSFKNAWMILQEKNNALAAERSNVQRYQQLEAAKQSLNLPSVSWSTTYVHLDDDIEINMGDIYAAFAALGSVTITDQDIVTSSIRAVWPIFTGFRISAAQQAAQGQTEEAQAKLKMEEQAQYEDLAKYYFSVVLAEEVLATQQSAVRGLTQHRDFAIKLEQQGQIAHVERLQAEASLDKAIIDMKKAKKKQDIAIAALTQILNQSEPVIPQSTLFVNDTLPPLSAFTQKTLKSYPGLAILDAKEKQAESLMAAEKGKYYPSVNLFGNYHVYDDDSFSLDLEPDWFVGVGVSVPLIDNSGRSNTIRAAYSAIQQVRSLRLQAKQDLTVLVQKTYLEAEQSVEEVKGLQSSQHLAEENLKLRKMAFNQGLATSLEVVDAELYLASMKIQQQLASFNYLISLNKLLALSREMTSFTHYETDASTFDSTKEAL
jgi:outer membrane protein TolC